MLSDIPYIGCLYIIGLINNNNKYSYVNMNLTNLGTICPSLILVIKVESCSRVVLVECDAG